MKLYKNIYNNKTEHIENKKINYNLNYERTAMLGYPLLLIALIIVVIWFVEYKHPYFFLQDDNRDYYLPQYIHNYKSILNGEIALYNFHQFLGTPHLAVGQSATLYPITYLSVFLSDLIFKHYFAAIDIMVILHLMIGSVGFYKFMRFFDIERKVSVFGGLTWSLSSFVVYVSNSWVIVSASAAYFPWMLFFSFSMYKNSSSKAIIGAVLVRLLLFYAGHIQYFIYSVIFEFITVILYVITDSEAGEKRANLIIFLKKYVVGYLCVLIFSLPLLLPMWNQMTICANRNGRLPFEVFTSRKFSILELISGLTIVGYGGNGYLSHIGVITIYFLIIGFIEKIRLKSKIVFINTVRLYVFLIPALISFLWSTSSCFNSLIYIIPILNRFRWPFKLALYFDFYLIGIATIILSNIIKRYSSETYKRMLFFFIIIVHVLNFAVLYSHLPYNFGTHGDKIPLEEKLQSQLVGGRIISIGFEIWSPGLGQDTSNFMTAPTLGFNYATLWGLDYFAGYEPLISNTNSDASLGLNFTAILESDKPIPIEYLRKAAVCWYVVPRDKVNEYKKIFNKYGIIKEFEDENRTIFYDSKAYPMVFNSSGEKIDNEDCLVKTNSIDLNVDLQRSDIIIFNNLYNPFFEGYVDGKKVEIKPINDIHFSISVPEGKHHIFIKYRDPNFVVGINIALVFLILIGLNRMIRILYKNIFKTSTK